MTAKTKISYTKPSITELEIRYVSDAIANGWGDRCYEYIARFESQFKDYLGVRYAIATSSCTGAMHMGLAGLGVGNGDEVILADTNWIATVAPVVHLGAIPVFVDILEDSWCLSPRRVEEAISSRTKAIIATHLYGNLCNMNELLSIGERYGIPVIEDSAEAIGSSYHGKRAGSIGVFGTFSFHGTKTITTGEGGMFVTNDADLHERVLTLSNHGRARSQKKQFWPDMVGYKYKISNLQAAVGCGQVERIEELTRRKREILQRYKVLEKIAGVEMNPEPEGCINGAWMPTVVFSTDLCITRENLQAAFAKENIDARVFFWPISSLPMFSEKRENENSWDVADREINLPSYHDITEDEIDRVINVVYEIQEKRGK